jgi:hypothetical protein
MNTNRLLQRLIFILTLVLSFISCNSYKTSHFQSESPLQIESPYYQFWVAGVQGGGSGVNVFLPIKTPAKITIDSLHFRGFRTAVETKPNLIVGYFKDQANVSKDLILSSEPHQEYGNQLPLRQDKSPFVLDNDACIISYRVKGSVQYFKITNLKEKPSIPYPSARPRTSKQ